MQDVVSYLPVANYNNSAFKAKSIFFDAHYLNAHGAECRFEILGSAEVRFTPLIPEKGAKFREAVGRDSVDIGLGGSYPVGVKSGDTGIIAYCNGAYMAVVRTEKKEPAALLSGATITAAKI